MRLGVTSHPDLTTPLTFLKGEFALWRYTIPYFSTLVPWDFARNEFTLIEKIPAMARDESTVAELFQRDIDWKRIDDDLVRYLRNDSRPQFFNALTLALLPKEGDAFATNYETDTDFDPLPDSDLEPTAVQIGGIQLQYYKDSGETAGKLRWDSKQIYAVAVDGQHRLAAIMELGDKPDPKKRDRTLIPAIILVPHPDAGLELPTEPTVQQTTTNTLRRIFIDLNKNAKSISRTRLILLDDQDVHRQCLRRLIGRKLSEHTEEGRLPLALVDWISDKRNKIDSGPFLTTVLLLEQLVHEILGRFPLANFSEPYAGEIENDADAELEDYENELEKVRKWLALGFAPDESQQEELLAQVSRCYTQQVPVTWMPDHLKLLADLFETRWAPHLYRLFRELTPYKTLWDYGQEQRLHHPQFINLYASRQIRTGRRARERAKDIIAEIEKADPSWSLDANYLRPLSHINEEIKEGHWAFTVVFQRALFNSYKRLLDQRREFVDDDSPDGGIKAFTDFWIGSINELFDKGLGDYDYTFGRPTEEFWRGIGLRSDGTIDFTKSGVDRIAVWISAWICLCDLEPVPTFKQLERAEDGPERIAARYLGQKRVLKGFLPLGEAALGPGKSKTKIEEQARSLLEKRYKHLRSLLR